MAQPAQTTAPLIELIFDRLATDDVPTGTVELVLAALTSEDDLTAALAGTPTRLDPRSPTGDGPAERVWLKSVTVAGFRGVGPERTIQIGPGPGFTMLVGRNGSGNVDGVATPTRVHRAWPVGAELTDAEVTVTSAKGRHSGLSELGLARPLELYRPFARPHDTSIKEVRAQRATLVATLDGIADERARRTAALLRGRGAVDLDAVTAILDEPDEVTADQEVLLCRELADLAPPSVDEVNRLAGQLREASHLIDDLTVPEGPGSEPTVGALRDAVAALRRVPEKPADLADHLAARYPAVVAVADAARAYAEGFLRQRDTGWRAAAADVRQWVAAAGGLAELAEQRQVVVFTHDTRLPDAVRRLDLGKARIIEVTRAERSVVTPRAGSDPVTRYLDDASALARNEEIPAEVRGPVVAELCASAVEAACHRAVWRTGVARGVPHADIETSIEDASRRVATIVALAVFDDAEKGGDVLGWLGRRHGRRAVNAYRACREGVHGAYLADLPGLVADARLLAAALS
ncbi:hypothetical protein AB0C06_14740 [Micromonospora inaquosa]|uniref:hypothetical protein n=1 Tax=Micromonospora inaquosa TaxID=2203716 RepID=UPI0033D86029